MKCLNYFQQYQAILLLVLAGYCPLKAQVHYTSVQMMERLLRQEMLTIDSVRTIVSDIRNSLAHLKGPLQELKLDHLETQDQMHKGNPVIIFKVVKRMALDFLDLLNDITELQKNVTVLTTPRQFPSYDDLFGIVKGIHRICDTYNLPLNDILLAGKFGNYKTEAGLSTDELLNFYLTSLFGDTDPLSVDELSEVVDRPHNFNDTMLEIVLEQIGMYLNSSNKVLYDESIMVANFMALMNYFMKRKEPEKATYFIDKIRERYPEAVEWAQNRSFIRKGLKKFIKNEEVLRKIEGNGADYQNMYNLACQGNLPIPEEIKAHLKCYYESYKNPFLRIGPLKVEELYLEPRVIKIYDAVTDNEINQIIDRSKGKIRRGRVVEKGGKTVYSDSRLSNVHFFEPFSYEIYPFLFNLDQRIIDMTNMVMRYEEKAKENLQSSNYGLGGYYDLHFDSTERDDPQEIWRMATLMFYLTDVEMGGATIFPSINLTIFPEKGTAILWYNAHANCLKDYRMYHSGCPVALGNKWVVNQWIPERNQLFIRPCIYGEEITDLENCYFGNWNKTDREYFTPDLVKKFILF